MLIDIDYVTQLTSLGSIHSIVLWLALFFFFLTSNRESCTRRLFTAVMSCRKRFRSADKRSCLGQFSPTNWCINSLSSNIFRSPCMLWLQLWLSTSFLFFSQVMNITEFLKVLKFPPDHSELLHAFSLFVFFNSFLFFLSFLLVRYYTNCVVQYSDLNPNVVSSFFDVLDRSSCLPSDATRETWHWWEKKLLHSLSTAVCALARRRYSRKSAMK